MTTQLSTILAGKLPFELPLFIVCTTLVIAWAIYLPSTVRDADRRKLAPNVPARVLFLLIYVLVFTALVTAFAFGGKKLMPWIAIGETSYWTWILHSFENQAPLLAVTILTFLHSIAYFRDLEHAFIIWLHSALYLKGDINTLKVHLKHCSFDPSPAERDKNIVYLRDFDVYVDESDVSALQLEAVMAWRKTSSLLRLIRLWNPDRGHILDDRDMQLLDDIEKAHARKTRLAMNIIRMLRQREHGQHSAQSITNLAIALASASHKDRDEIAEIENRIRGALGRDGEGTFESGPMHLTQTELQHHLAQIESYFRVEYAQLLQQTSELASKSVVLAGDDAAQRLEQLKSIGFGQLGRVEAINFDRILWVFFAIALVGFLIFFFFPRPQNMRIAFSPILMAQVAFVTALATLIGAVVGSNRRLASKPSTPWTAYVAAGLIAFGGFVAVHGTSFLVKNLLDEQRLSVAATSPDPAAGTGAPVAPSAALDAASPAGDTSAAPAETSGGELKSPFDFRLRDMLPWAATPFFLAIAICWLARQPGWPRPQSVPAGVWERSIDGFFLVAVMMFAQATAMALHFSFETPFAEIMRERMKDDGITNPLFIILRPNPIMLIGFIVGAFVVRDVRIAAHAQLTDNVALAAYMASERLGTTPVSSAPRGGQPGEAAPSPVLLPQASGA
ncbi:MAG: hypothetical protein NW216_08520 [Hyphomicrobium sp.]|nr:hypothetical protein [Hyphomicrobium sp.]